MSDDRPEFPPNPPGYGDVIGGVVLFEPTDDVIEAACVAFHGSAEEWFHWRASRRPAEAEIFRWSIRKAITAAVEASS